MNGKDSKQERQTFIDEGSEFKGTLASECPVVVKGAIDGDLMAPALTVADSGSVQGKIEAETIRSEGTLAGEIDATDLFLAGTVKSDTVIRATNIEVKLRQDGGKLEVTFGKCIVEAGDEPQAKQVDGREDGDGPISIVPADARSNMSSDEEDESDEDEGERKAS